MSIRLVKQGYPIARKKHICRACEDMRNGWSVDEIIAMPKLPEEQEIFRVALIDDSGYIQKGEKYYQQTCENDGDIYAWRCKTDVYKIAVKYSLLRDCD